MRRILLCGVLSLLMFALAGCSKEEKNLIETEQGIDSVSIKQVEEATINIDGSDYKAGVYKTSLVLSDGVVDFEVTIGGSGFDEIRMFGLSEEMASTYPYLQSTFEDIAQQILSNQSLNDITYPDDAKYTAMIIIDAIKSALQKAEVTSGSLEGGLLGGISSKDNSKWQEAYTEWIDNLKASDYTIHSTVMTLEDLNSDDIPELIFVNKRAYSTDFVSGNTRVDIDAYDSDIFILSYVDGNLIEYNKRLENLGSSTVDFCYVDTNKYVLSYVQYIPTSMMANNFGTNGTHIVYKSIINVTETGFEDGSTYTLSQYFGDSEDYYAKDGTPVDKDVYNEIIINYAYSYLKDDRISGSLEAAIEYYEERNN